MLKVTGAPVVAAEEMAVRVRARTATRIVFFLSQITDRVNRAGTCQGRRRIVTDMDVLAETLNAKLHEWEPETAAQVRERVAEIIGMVDQDGLDLLRSRSLEQDVLDLLDAPASRRDLARWKSL